VEISKTDIFFELLSAVYGRAKVAAQWPTERDEQIIRAMVSDKIESMTVEDIRAAIDNARNQRMKEVRGFEWPDVDLILSGSKRHLTAAHRPFLPEPSRDIPPIDARAEIMRKLRIETGL